MDQTHSSLRAHIPLKIRKDHYRLDTAKPVEIRLFIDGSVVEGFINNEDAFTTRIFPLKEIVRYWSYSLMEKQRKLLPKFGN